MCSVVHSCPSKLFSRLYPQWSFQNTHIKMSHILLLKPLNAFPLGLGQRSNSLMVHKIYSDQNLLRSAAYLHITLPSSLRHHPSVPHHHARSHPRARALHTPPILFQLAPTYTNPSFFFLVTFLKMSIFFSDSFFFNYFTWRLITLQYCSGFPIHWHESAMGIHVFTILSPLPTCFPIPSLWDPPSAPVLSTLSHASNLDWWSVSHTIIYMFQCYSLKPSHPCLLPQSPKDCSIHLCLFCCLAYRVIITIFLNSIIYALVYCIGAFLSDLLHSV